MATPDTTARQEELFAELDALAANLSQSSLQYGWKAMELWNVSQEDFMEEAGGKEKKALGAFISVVQEREAKDIEKRNTIAERIRVAKFIPTTLYSKIVTASDGYEPTYHQIRAVVFMAGGELDETKTTAMIDWCVANKWPTVADIRIQRGVVDPKVAVDPAERHFKVFVKLSQAIMAETTPGSDRYNAAKGVLDAWKKENSLA